MTRNASGDKECKECHHNDKECNDDDKECHDDDKECEWRRGKSGIPKGYQ